MHFWKKIDKSVLAICSRSCFVSPLILFFQNPLLGASLDHFALTSLLTHVEVMGHVKLFLCKFKIN